jgi:hypothetical protein
MMQAFVTASPLAAPLLRYGRPTSAGCSKPHVHGSVTTLGDLRPVVDLVDAAVRAGDRRARIRDGGDRASSSGELRRGTPTTAAEAAGLVNSPRRLAPADARAGASARVHVR